MIKEYPNSEIFKCVVEEIANGKNVQLRVKGNSMFPFIREGDCIILIPCNLSKLQIGDVVLFNYNKEVHLHRLIDKKENNLILQGDGNINAVEIVELQDIIAKLQQIIRKKGKKVNAETWRWYFFFYLWFYVRPFRAYILKLYRLCNK